MIRALILAAVAGVLCAGLFAPASTRAEELVLRVETADIGGYPTIRATVSVLEGSGRPVAGLGREAFQAQAGGQDAAVVSVANATNEGLGIGLVLAFDVSGSMAGAPVQQAQAAGAELIRQLGAGDEVAVLSFSATAGTVQGFTADPAVASAAISGLSVAGDTALYDGVAASVALASQSAQPRRAVVLLSDGLDTVGTAADRGGSLEAARAAGIPFFVVALGGQVDLPYLGELADASRGQLLAAPTQDSLVGLYTAIGAVLRQQYVVTVEAAELSPGSDAALVITVSRGGVTASGELPFTVPGEPPAPAAPPPAEPAPAEPAPAEPAAREEPSGGGVPSPAILLVPVVAGAALIAWRVRKRMMRPPPDLEFRLGPAQEIAPPDPTPSPPKGNGGTAAPPDASLLVATPEATRTYRLGTAPVTIGFTPECDIRLPSGSGESRQMVRVWRREGRFMAHALSPGRTVSISGQPVSWAVLEEGDEIEMGGCRLSFHVSPAGAAVPPGLLTLFFGCSCIAPTAGFLL